ncbi:EAL domain-containing protein [Amycolatopsis sp. YIM 10]|uniref:EAL domain-containing protein n=1 Tax=Amycolatopsis sp. YIM 10 TaxID=2653857 RepID=UPI00129035F3|nr:EAL domain-containing protein [Amycolatopsis sp. YIM 10]QFU86669.1 RNase II stability modulator [Amycolatopsis sp. YIM 10]
MIPREPAPHSSSTEETSLAAAESRVAELVEWLATADERSLPPWDDSDLTGEAETAAARARGPVLPGLELTADDAREFGRRWHRSLAIRAFIRLAPASAEPLFAYSAAALLAHLGAPVTDPANSLNLVPPVPVPAAIGHTLAYEHKLAAESLGECVALVLSLAAEYTPLAPQALKVKLVGEFASGFATGLQERVRDEQTALTTTMLRLCHHESAGAPQRYRAADAQAPQAVLLMNERGHIMEANPLAQDLLNRTLAQLRTLTLVQLSSSAEDRAQIERALGTLRENTRARRERACAEIEFRIHQHRQPPRWIRATVGYASTGQRSINVLLDDITLQHGLENGSDVNAATGLLTETAFTSRAERVLAGAPGNATLLTIRLAGWAQLGHALPEHLLTQLLWRISTRIHAAHELTQYHHLIGHNGDDVLVLLHQLTDWSTVIRLVKQLSDWLRDPVRIDGHQIRLQPRIGITEARPGHTLDDLLRCTRRALHDTADTRELWTHADTGTDEDARRTLDLHAELTTALDTAALHVDYQLIRTAQGSPVGVHPTPYWTSPDGTRHDITEIADLAGHTGLLTTALPLVLERVTHHTQAWHHAGWDPFILLDMPGHTIHDEPLLDTLTATAAHLQSGQLHLAIPARSLTGAPAILSRLTQLPTATTPIQLAMTNFLDDHAPIRALNTIPWATITLADHTVAALTHAKTWPTSLTAIIDTAHAVGARTLATTATPAHIEFDLYLTTAATNPDDTMPPALSRQHRPND